MQICKVDSFNIILLFFLAVNCCSEYACSAYEQQSYPQKHIAVISGLRACCILATGWRCCIGFISFGWLCLLRSCLFNLKIRTALAVCIPFSVRKKPSKRVTIFCTSVPFNINTRDSFIWLPPFFLLYISSVFSLLQAFDYDLKLSLQLVYHKLVFQVL